MSDGLSHPVMLVFVESFGPARGPLAGGLPHQMAQDSGGRLSRPGVPQHSEQDAERPSFVRRRQRICPIVLSLRL